MTDHKDKIKKAWITPELIVHGDVDRITKGKGGNKIPGIHDTGAQAQPTDYFSS
jgi:hypothetical protein